MVSREQPVYRLARASQLKLENFFRYMMKHFAIDTLSEYGVEDFHATQTVINPSWRRINKELTSLNRKLKTRRANYTKLILAPELDEKKMAKWISAKATALEEVEQYEHSVANIKIELKEKKKHIYWKDLSKEDKFMNLPSSLKCFTDTIKMIAYRAETSMMGVVREKYVRKDNIRDLLVTLFKSDADLIPDEERETLTDDGQLILPKRKFYCRLTLDSKNTQNGLK